MIKKNALRSAIALATTAVAFNAAALEPAQIKAGGMTITPVLSLSETYDDNIRENGINEQSSWVTNINPSVLVEAIDGLNVYQLEYDINHALVHSARDDDYTNHKLRGMAHFELNSRNRLTFNARYDHTETLTDTTVLDESDKFKTLYADAVYGFGVPTAIMNADLGVNYTRMRTRNSDDINADREYDRFGMLYTLYYRIGPRTRLLAEYRYDDYEYELTPLTIDNSSAYDNKRHRAYVGATWAATAKTTGSVRVGYERRKFDDNNVSDTNGASWEADLTWTPRTYSTVTLSTSKSVEPGRISSRFVDTTQVGANWNHYWTPRFSSDLFYRWADEEYKYQSSPLDRDDDLHEAGFEVRYDVQRWMTVGLGFRWKDRDSDVAARDYDRSLATINLKVSL